MKYARKSSINWPVTDKKCFFHRLGFLKLPVFCYSNKWLSDVLMCATKRTRTCLGDTPTCFLFLWPWPWPQLDTVGRTK